MTENLEQKIESVLFWKAEPVKISELAKMFEVNQTEINTSIENLKLSLDNRGISIIINDETVSLVTAPESAEIIQKLQKEELTKNLSKAALETLSIIMYRGPIKRSDIDYIRGVNSQFTLRALLVRGLIDKKQDKNDERAYVYNVSTDTLAHIGVSSVNDLPEFESVNSDIDNFLNSNDNEEIDGNGDNEDVDNEPEQNSDVE